MTRPSLPFCGACHRSLTTRIARIVVPGLPHHVTQRGKAREVVPSLRRRLLGLLPEAQPRAPDPDIAVGDKLACLRGKIADNRGGIGVRRFGDDEARHYFRGAAKRAALRALCSSRVMKSPRSQRRQALVNQRLRPCHIIVVVARVVREFSDAVVDQLARRFLDRRKMVGRDVPLDPRFLFGCEGYRHAFLYHENRPVSTVKLGRQYGTEFRNKKPLSLPDDLARALGRQPLMGSDLVPEAPFRRPCLPRSAARLAASSDRKKNDSMCLENVKEESGIFRACGPWGVKEAQSTLLPAH